MFDWNRLETESMRVKVSDSKRRVDIDLQDFSKLSK